MFSLKILFTSYLWCEELLKMFNEDKNFITNLTTSDKATFHVKGYVNRHNCKIWGSEPRNGICIKSHSSLKVYVCAGVTCSGVIGPYFLKLKSVIFQQNGTPPHYALKVSGFLDANFKNNWIDCISLTY